MNEKVNISLDQLENEKVLSRMLFERVTVIQTLIEQLNAKDQEITKLKIENEQLKKT